MKTLGNMLCALPFIAIQGVAVADQDEVERAEEETIIFGSRVEGDYTFITEDTQKLVETAGSLGDPLGAIFALPGVVYSDASGQEPAVRGSSPADNSFVVDFLPASYIFHEFGVSVFSEFILHDFQMYSAGFGAEYGAATGAVFDINLRDPKNEDFSGVADISMLRSGIFVESGVTENSAFYLSARKSLLDLFIKEDDIGEEDGLNVKTIPKDSDYQFKYQWKPNQEHKISFSANGATDKAEAEFTQEADFVRSNPDFAGDAGIQNKYNGQSLLWEMNKSNGHQARIGIGTLKDRADIFWGNGYLNEVELKQNNVKAQYSIPFGQRYRVTVGAQNTDYAYHYLLDQVLFACTEFDSDCELRRRGRIREESDLEVTESMVYLNNTIKPTDKLTLNVGVQHQKNDFNDESFNHPRLSIAYDLSDNWSITSKAGSYNRFPDLGTTVPEIGNPDIKSPTANHYTLGFQHFMPNEWSISVEAYYKTLENLPRSLDEDEENSDLLYVSETEGEAYGVDILVNKNLTDKIYGWFSLSYGKSERTDLRTDQTKDYHLDTPLIANWVVNYQFRPKWNIAWRWSVRSGNSYTPIVGVQENPYFEDSVLPIYGEAYSDRLPLYNRLDVRMKYDFLTFGRDSAIILDVINALNYTNVSSRTLDFEKVESVSDEVKTEDSAGIGITPALTYRVHF